MDQSSQLKPDLFSDQASDVSVTSNNHDICLNKEGDHEIINATPVQAKDEGLAKMDERNGRVHPTVDIAEILRRWTHALQRIHKQANHLVNYVSCFYLLFHNFSSSYTDFLIVVYIVGQG